MTEIEYDIIDELYFVTPYAALKEEIDYTDDELSKALKGLVEQGLIRVYTSMDEESEIEKVNMNSSFRTYFYLASKKGLFEHNSR